MALCGGCVGTALGGGVLVAVAASACVPATDETDPRGAFLLVVEPTPATRGEPFLTSDGWDVTIEALAVHGHASGDDSRESVRFVCDGSAPFELLVRAAPARTIEASIFLLDARYDWSRHPERDLYRRVTDDVFARFQRPADGMQPDECSSAPGALLYCPSSGPAFYLVARAERAERTVRVEVALAGAGLLGTRRVPIPVRANALTRGQIPLRGEALLTNDAGALVFDDLADADANADGVIDYDELLAATDPEYEEPIDRDSAFNPPIGTMASTVLLRGRGLFPPGN